MAPSVSLLIHISGLIAVSQFIFTEKYEQYVYGGLNSNVSDVLHGALDSILVSVSATIPLGFGSGFSVGALLKTIVYSAATLYILYISRLVKNYCCVLSFETDYQRIICL